MQPVKWVPSSTCVREKPEGFSFCRAQVDEGLLRRRGRSREVVAGGTFAARTSAGFPAWSVQPEAAQVGFGPVSPQGCLVVLGVLLFGCCQQLGGFLEFDARRSGQVRRGRREEARRCSHCG